MMAKPYRRYITAALLVVLALVFYFGTIWQVIR